jgi:hypothetical protein
MPKSKGWKREPARHALAAKGLKIGIDESRRAIRTHAANLAAVVKMANAQLTQRWRKAKPFLQDGMKILDEAKLNNSKGAEGLEEEIFDTCLDFAMEAYRYENNGVLKELRALTKNMDEDPIENAADIIRDDYHDL